MSFLLFGILLREEVAGQISDDIDVSELFSMTQAVLDYSIKISLGEKPLSAGHGDTRKLAASSKVFEAKADVQRAILQAQASPLNRVFTEKRLRNLLESIHLAVNAGSFKFARWALGTGMFGQVKFEQKARRRKTRSLSDYVDNFLTKVKRKITIPKFKEMMSVDRDSTLMFAIDTTGSMRGEIDAAKAIAKAIVDWPRNQNITVEYVLAPFNDPG